MRNGNLEKIDYSMISILILISIVSFISLYHVGELYQEYFVTKQLFFYGLGAVLFFLAAYFDMSVLKKLSLPFYLFALFLLIGIFFLPFSKEINYARGWYVVGGLSFQPAELMKLALILSLAAVADRYKHRVNDFKTELKMMGEMAAYFFPAALVVMEFPDYGNVLVYAAIFLAVLFVSKIRWRTILSLLALPGILIIAFVLLYFFLPDFFFNQIIDRLPGYQASRFYGWLRPEEYAVSGYQVRQSLLSIGAGYWEGYEQLPEVPYAYSDLIFAVIGGSYGFIGSSVVLMLYFLLLYRVISISITYQESFGSYVGAGVTGFICFQVFQNIGMSVGLLPVTGLGLPLISYGGSALLVALIGLGLVLNAKLHTENYMFAAKE